jgi:hypothetical protein
MAVYTSRHLHLQDRLDIGLRPHVSMAPIAGDLGHSVFGVTKENEVR